MALQDDFGHDEDASSLVLPLSLPLPPVSELGDPEATSLSDSVQPTSFLAFKIGISPPTNSTTVTAAAASRPAPALNSAQNGDGKDAETRGDMSSHQHYPGGPGNHQHGQQNPYATSSAGAYSPSPAVSLSPNPYASYSPTAIPSHSGDPYRANSVVSSSMSLPSMRTIDPVPQQAGPPHLSHSPVGLNMNMASAQVPSSMPYYPHQSVAATPPYGLPPDAMARYALPHDPRLLGSRGPKKEIKRRTKTGCLTCRKRRIKCDETHPTCNNCKKSKRECLGYDPIFRQTAGSQSTSPLANTQSLLGAGGSQSSPASQPTTPSSASVSVSVSHPSSSTVGPRQTATYNTQHQQHQQHQHQHHQQHQHQPYFSSQYPSNHSPTPTPIATPTSTTSVGYDVSYPPSVSATPSAKNEPCYQLSPGGLDHTFRMLPTTTIHHDNTRTLDTKFISDHSTHLRAKKMRVDDIISMLGPMPPAQQVHHSEEIFHEVTKVYHEMYAGGLSAFFETSWYYFVEDGKMAFPRNPRLVELFTSFLKLLEAVKANDHAQMAYSGVLETRVVWELARAAFQFPDKSNNAPRTILPPDGDPVEAGNRLRVVEALLCGDYLPSNPLAFPIHDADIHRTRQYDFWYNLAEVIRIREDPDSPPVVKARDAVLARLRHLLDGRENRDVLYSIAVVRELAPNYDPGFGSTLPQHLDETDPKNRLAVASKFIMDEAQVTGGTTNVVRRFSDIAARAFVNPGVNVARRT